MKRRERLSLAWPMQARNFPPHQTGVLLPLGSRRAAALGVCMYTTSNTWPFRLQLAVHLAVRVAGARIVPSRTQAWPAEYVDDGWGALHDELRASLGPFDQVAVYQRKQSDRTGLTLTLVRGREPLALVKLRSDPTNIEREQKALHAVDQARPGDFLVPQPLGLGTVDVDGESVHWSAQTAVFTRPHRAEVDAPATLFGQVSDALADLFPKLAGHRPAHNDIAPWNLRLDHRGRRWLFDWEDCGQAPLDSDRVYYSACLNAVRGTVMPTDLESQAVEYWRSLLIHRRDTTVSDQDLTGRLLAALPPEPGGEQLSDAPAAASLDL